MLFALGAGAALLPSLGRREAFADSRAPSPLDTPAAPPRRIVFFLSQHGTVYDSWTMPGAAPDVNLGALTNASQMSRILAPLFPHRGDLCVLDGIFMLSARLLDGTQNHNAHSVGQAHALTGVSATQQNLAGGISIDQVIANGLLATSPTAVASLDVGVYNGSEFSYTAPNTRVPVWGNPEEAFDSLFAGMGGTVQQRAQMRAQRKSILDFAAAEMPGMRAGLSASDKVKLDSHLSTLRDWEQRVVSAGAAACAAPTRPTQNAAGPSNVGGAYGLVATAQFSNIAAAFACNMTNVATVTMSQMPYQEFQGNVNYDMSQFPNDVHQDFAHRADDPTYAGQPDVPHAHEAMSGYHQKHAQQFAALVAMLKATPEPFDSTGKSSVFDSTMVVWCGELASGFHQFTPWPVVVAAGSKVNIARGHYLRWPTIVDRDVRATESTVIAQLAGGGNPTSMPASWLQVSHQNILAALGTLMGQKTATFGDPRLCSGPLARFMV